MKNSKSLLGKVLYAFLFLFFVPLLLFFWAEYTENIVQYPPIKSTIWGISIGIIGIMLIFWGMYSLAKYGKGLPMNAYPPPKFVKEGPYLYLRHPIYWGFGLLLIGFFIAIGSSSGLWLVTPLTILCVLALVLGFENISLKERFPDEKMKVHFDIPNKGEENASLGDLISSFLMAFIPFLMGNFITIFLVRDVLPEFGDPWNISLVFKGIQEYYLSFLFVMAVPFVVKKKNILREWTISILIAIISSVYISLLWPSVGAQYLSPNLQTSNTFETISIVLINLPFFLILLSLKAYLKQFKKFAFIFFLFAIFLGIVQLTNSKSPILHFIISLFIFILASFYERIWMLLKNFVEKIANSWKEWVFGPVRVINHGFYVGFGSFLGILIAGCLTGKVYAWALLAFAISVIIFSALWAQIIEGSEKLKRPFGYYGALVGIIFASFVVWFMGVNVWVIIGVVSVVMPWVQAIGRFRCLVNGCCHGSPTKNQKIGIRYFHYRSRVCGISGLEGALIHPTPLYSILWLFLIGFILLSLWSNHFSYPFIFGIYLILTGIGRFVEEAYRGEVQTIIWKGLRLYQWTAIISVLIGIGMTTLPIEIVELQPGFDWEIAVSAFLGGLITFIAMGVDFPNSNARFSRLV